MGGLVYSGDIVLAITADKIDSGKASLLAERSIEDLKQFKHVEAPKEINVAVLRSLFELLGLSPGLAQLATQGSEEPVKQLLEAVSKLVGRVLTAGTDLPGRLSFWGRPLLTDDEIRDWRARLEALKAFTEGLTPYNTVGKLKNLRIGSDDIDTTYGGGHESRHLYTTRTRKLHLPSQRISISRSRTRSNRSRTR